MKWLTKRALWPRIVPLAMILALVALVVLQYTRAQARIVPRPLPAIAPSDVGDLALARGDGPVTLSATDRAVLALKWQLAQEYSQMQAGKLAPATFAYDWQHFVAHYGATTGHPIQAPSFGHCPLTTTRPAAPCHGFANQVRMPQESQINRYYCGPAATEEMLLALGATTGPRGENLLASPFPGTGQHILAGKEYLQTDLDVGTNWGSGVVPYTLNAWNHNHYYVAVNGPDYGGNFTLTQFIQSVILDVDAGHPIEIGIRMDPNPSAPHLVGYPPNQAHYHWISLNGYTTLGEGVMYADSVHGDTSFWSWAKNVPAYSTVSSQYVMYPLALTYGYIW